MYDPFEAMYTGTWGTRLLNIISGTALLVAASWFSYSMFATRSIDLAPRIVNTITVEPSILLAGKPFRVRVNVTLNKLCPYEVHWSLVRKTDGVEVVKIIEPIKPAALAVGTQDLSPSDRWVPSSVDPGEYRYVVEVLDMCGEGHTYTSLRRSVDLTIR